MNKMQTFKSLSKSKPYEKKLYNLRDEKGNCKAHCFQKSRSSPSEVFLGKSALKLWSEFTEEHPCRNTISIKLQSDFI